MDCSQGKTKRLLVVDDTDAVRRVLAAMLRIEGGFNVDSAGSGLVALDMLSKNEYDILLVDLGMPGMSGMELYQRIKEKHPEVADKVIFMSADIQNIATQHLIAKAKRPFLLKPFTVDDLMRYV